MDLTQCTQQENVLMHKKSNAFYELHPKNWTKNPTEEVQFFMTKYSIDEKKRVVDIVNDELNIYEAAWRTGISETVIRDL